MTIRSHRSARCQRTPHQQRETEMGFGGASAGRCTATTDRASQARQAERDMVLPRRGRCRYRLRAAVRRCRRKAIPSIDSVAGCAGGKLEWRWERWPPKRPLYGLQRLAERPCAAVVVCEGEKAADAAARLLSGYVAVTSPNGSKSAAKADWSPLQGRAVTVWPDADAAGLEYARTSRQARSPQPARSRWRSSRHPRRSKSAGMQPTRTPMAGTTHAGQG